MRSPLRGHGDCGVSTVASMFAITDGSGNIVSGTEKARGGGSTIGAVLTAEATVTTTGPATYLLRGRNGGAGAGTATILNASGTSTISWQKVSDFVPATLVAAVAGDRKFSDLLIDHGDWILLNGRLKSTLTAAQQAVATSLGYGTNIPDMRGRMALGIGGTIGATALSQGGSSTIGQNQLPNVALSGTISNFLAVVGGGSQASGGFTSGISGVPGWINGGSQSSGWPGGGNVTIGSLNGGVTQQVFVPSYAAGNWFVWLGSSATTVTAGTAVAKPELPAVGAITKGRPVEWFDNLGVPSVRDCLQGTPGLSAPFDLSVGNAAGAETSCVVSGNFNTNFFVRADNGTLIVNRHTFNANGTLSASSSSSGTIPTNTPLINGAASLGAFGNENRALFTISDNSSNVYAIGVNTLGITPTVGSVSAAFPGTRSCVAPSSRSSGEGFWFLAGANLYEMTVSSTGVLNQFSAGALSIGTLQGSGQPTQLHYAPNAPGTRDTLWAVVQRSDNSVYYCNFALNIGGSSLGTGGQRANANVNSSVGALQTLPMKYNGGLSNWIYVSGGGQAIVNYVDGNTNGNAANISGAYVPPNFPSGFNPTYVQICPKNYDPRNIPSSSVSAGAPIVGGGSYRYVMSYTAPNTTLTYYCDFSFNFADLTFTTNFTATIGHPEVVNGVEGSRPSSLQRTLTDPACFFIHRVAGIGADRYRNVIAGSTSVSSNVFAIADATVTNGQPCPLNFEGDVLTGLSGLTPGAKHYLNTTNGSLTTTNSGVPLYHALDAARAVVKINP
jgi:hypothetical protein